MEQNRKPVRESFFHTQTGKNASPLSASKTALLRPSVNANLLSLPNPYRNNPSLAKHSVTSSAGSPQVKKSSDQLPMSNPNFSEKISIQSCKENLELKQASFEIPATSPNIGQRENQKQDFNNQPVTAPFMIKKIDFQNFGQKTFNDVKSPPEP
ncbi:hypothetical protein HK096_001028, partial [Nowakowskiella sp. JEL0078]